jgi:hypothetical protein
VVFLKSSQVARNVEQRIDAIQPEANQIFDRSAMLDCQLLQVRMLIDWDHCTHLPRLRLHGF